VVVWIGILVNIDRECDSLRKKIGKKGFRREGHKASQSSQRKKVKKGAKLESRQDDIMETFSPVFFKE